MEQKMDRSTAAQPVLNEPLIKDILLWSMALDGTTVHPLLKAAPRCSATLLQSIPLPMSTSIDRTRLLPVCAGVIRYRMIGRSKNVV